MDKRTKLLNVLVTLYGLNFHIVFLMVLKIILLALIDHFLRQG